MNSVGLVAVVVWLTFGGAQPPDMLNAYPEWTYDAPFYIRPVQGPLLDTSVQPYMPLEYYVKDQMIQIARPPVGDPRKVPRIAIWLTRDGGMRWNNVGYFGRQQSYFPLRAKLDGDYAIRFMGPGIAPPSCRPPRPHRVYYVDTTPPKVTVFVSPAADAYAVGQIVTLQWTSEDKHLEDNSAQIGSCFNYETVELSWTKLGKWHATDSRVDIAIPEVAVHKSVVFRVSVSDKAGNLGHGFSCPLWVVLPEELQPTSQPSQPGLPKVLQSDAIPSVPRKRAGKVVETEQILTTRPAEYPGL